ncbi:hypothetical protein ETU08_02555 [Apibacter muscae]|uniref:ArnT family glycosyltransferase n=1 Tax=Apibacter muscae TaxID=2509004 RepID=UPI0011ADA14E|nr:glycosyltransferase family 39 protein [Apibacter muscae]TWP30904.1 hypothetical protein ETU08_02555 [Apibacter muscae]
MKSNKATYTLIFIVSAIILLANLSIIPINIMEARNFITAREMVEDGNWLLTTMNGMPRYEKPPLPTWITAAFGFVLDFETTTFLRLPSAIITMIMVFYIYKFSLKLNLSKKSSLNNALILITSFYIYFAGRDNQWDIYCHSFMIVSIYYLWNLLQSDSKPLKNTLLGGIFLAFSILSKGPISLYALLLPFIIAYGFTYKFNLRNKQVNKSILIYIIIGVIIGSSWSIYIHFKDPEPLAAMTKIETSRWISDYNSKPFYYYWDFFLQSGIWSISSLISLQYFYLKNKVSNKKAYTFTLLWTVSSLILLSIIPEKKVRYLLPTLIPLALNTGFFIEYLINGKKNKKDRILGMFNFILLGIVGVLYPLVLFLGFYEKISSQLNWAIISSLFMFFTGCLIIYFSLKKNFKQGFYTLIAYQCIIMVFVFPLAKSFTHNTNFKSAKDLRTLIKTNIELYSYKYMTPEIVWDYGKKIPTITDDGLKEMLPHMKDKHIGLICIPQEIKHLQKEYGNKFNVKKVSYIDLNIVSPDNENYNDRLYKTFVIMYQK